MNKQYLPVREVWEFEQYLASSPDVWINEAINLRYSAEVLCLYQNEVLQPSHQKHENARLPGFWSAGVARMLMGFSLENLIKAILLQDPARLKTVFGREGNLSWGRDGHDLLKLFTEASLEISSQEQRYIALWQICALWAGRYPIPSNEHGLPRQRKALASSEELLQRAQKRIEAAKKARDPLLGVDIDDLLHIGIGSFEIDIFRSLCDKCSAVLPTSKE